MSNSELWLIVTIALPALMALACFSRRVREQILHLLPLAALPGLIAAFRSRGDAVPLGPSDLGLTLALDDVGAVLLGGASLLWSVAALYAGAAMKHEAGAHRFAVWWLLTLAGSSGTFLAADVVSFYLTFSLASLAAYGLVIQKNSRKAHRAGIVYMILALAGEAFLLLAFVMLAGPAQVGNPLIRDAVALLPGSPYEGAIIALLILGFGLKMGLVPLHIWMPLAHPVAPFTASAALSGVIVKAGVIGLIRFLPVQSAVAEWGTTLLAIGLLTALYGVAIGLTQQKLKTILAYSTVSQMGVIAAILGGGLAQGNVSVSALAAFYALHHMLVKGALFLGLGIYTGMSPANRQFLFWPMAILALSLAGLPFTSGAAAKFATKDVFATAGVAWLATVSTVGSGLLMIHFLLLLRRETSAGTSPALPIHVQAAWAVMVLSTLLVPAAILPLMTNYTLSDVLSWNGLLAAAWPVALAALLAMMLRHAPLPRIPEGDIIVVFQKSVPAFLSIGRVIEWSDDRLKSWPMACFVLLGIAVALGSATLWPL